MSRMMETSWKAKITKVDCLEEKCAWYLPGLKLCAILSVARDLPALRGEPPFGTP